MAERQMERKLATWAAGLGVISLLGVYERSLVKRDELAAQAALLEKQVVTSLKPVESLLETLETNQAAMHEQQVEHGLILRGLQTTVDLLVKNPPQSRGQQRPVLP